MLNQWTVDVQNSKTRWKGLLVVNLRENGRRQRKLNEVLEAVLENDTHRARVGGTVNSAASLPLGNLLRRQTAHIVWRMID